MSMIKCPECNREISDMAEKCPNCGFPINKTNISEQKVKNKSEMRAARVAISVIFLVLSIFVLFQSCAVGTYNALENNVDALDGTIGMLVAISMIILGIVGICTKKSRSNVSINVLAIISVLIGLFCCFGYDGIFEDLKVWGILFFIYSIIFIFAGYKIKYNNKN